MKCHGLALGLLLLLAGNAAADTVETLLKSVAPAIALKSRMINYGPGLRFDRAEAIGNRLELHLVMTDVTLGEEGAGYYDGLDEDLSRDMAEGWCGAIVRWLLLNRGAVVETVFNDNQGRVAFRGRVDQQRCEQTSTAIEATDGERY